MPYAPLSQCERDEILVALTEDPAVSFAEIGRRISRHPTTIGREIFRNGGRDGYRAGAAQARAEACRSRPKVPKLLADPTMGALVTGRLREGYSPAGIAAMLDQAVGAGVCAETIYRGVYTGELGVAGRDCLRRRRPRRRPRQRINPDTPTHVLGEFTPISARPDSVSDRSEFGHWEGDLIIGARNRSAIITLVERLTRLVVMLALPHGYRADKVHAALDRWVATMPHDQLTSVTWDRGSEMTHWLSLRLQWGLDVYFCDPHAPWQRGTNEHTNGLLRWWLPKSTDLTVHTQDDLDHITTILNSQPRRSLRWLTPTQSYDAHTVR